VGLRMPARAATYRLAIPLLVLLGPASATSDDRPVPPSFQTTSNPGPPRWSVGAEAGWNGLGGVGPIVACSPRDPLVLEGALGYSRNGLALGLRARGLAAVVGLAGLTAGAGLVATAGHSERVSPRPEAFPSLLNLDCLGAPGCPASRHVSVGSTLAAQVTVGLELRGSRGGGLLLLGGYSRLLGGGRATWSAPPSEQQARYVRQITGSGPVVSLALRFGL